MSEINASVKVKNAANVTGHQELLNEEPILVMPRLATLIGLNEAIVLQQIQYWIRKNMSDPTKEHTHFIDGRWWTYNQISEWEKQFPFWSYNTVKRTIAALEQTGILVSGHYNKDKFGRPDPRNRTKWYTIDYEIITMHCAKVNDALAQNELMRRMADTEDGYGKSPSEPSIYALAQNELMQELKLGQSYTETNKTENKKEKNAQARDYEFSNGKSVALKTLPEDWEILPALREKVKQEYGLTDTQITDAGKRFKAKNLADGIQKNDWVQAFMYWCSNYKEPRKTFEKFEKIPKDKPKYIDTSNRTGMAPLAKVVENITVEKSPEEQLHRDIIGHLLDKEKVGVMDLHDSGLAQLKIEQTDDDCLRFKSRTEGVEVSMGERHQEMILRAINALGIKIKRIEFE